MSSSPLPRRCPPRGPRALAWGAAAAILLVLGTARSGAQVPPPPVVQPVVVEEYGVPYFGVRFQREPPLGAAVHLEVQRSGELGDWSSGGLKLYSVIDVDTNTQQVVFRSTAPMPGQGREFLRVEQRPRMPAAAPYLAMTFDDGPHPVQTPLLLDLLRERNIRATFFVVGLNADWHPHVLQRMINEGHEIGNHTMTHPDLQTLPRAEVIAEVADCHAAIVDAATVPPVLIRPPYGSVNKQLRSLFQSEFGYPTILWDVDPRDWELPGPDVVADRIVNGAFHGAIILAHDIHAETVEAMPDTFDRLLAQGYVFVTVSELLALEGP